MAGSSGSFVGDVKNIVVGVGKEVNKLKKTDNVLMRTRDKILAMFKSQGSAAEKASIDAMKKNKLLHADVANQKIGKNYDEEWGRLWRMVQDTFTNMGRNDLAQNFGGTVPVYNENKHDISYISTLLNGASSNKPITVTTVTSGPNGVQKEVAIVPSPVQSANKDFSMLSPFRGTMQQILNAQGFTAPEGMEDLSQLFYNKIVAKGNGNYQPVDFYDLPVHKAYHLDESIVNAVVGYFKDLADRKKKGEVLPKWQDAAATKAIEVEQNLTNAAKNEVAKDIGTSLMSKQAIIMIIIIIVLAIIGAILIFRR